MKYEVTLSQITKVIVDNVESMDEAIDALLMMSGDDIAEHDPHEYTITEIRLVSKGEANDKC